MVEFEEKVFSKLSALEVAIADSNSLTAVVGVSDGNETTNTITDSTKNLDNDSLATRLIKFTVDSVEYIREILSCTGSTFTFNHTVAASNAMKVIGPGAEGFDGVVMITCKGSLAGAAGNDVTLVMMAGNTDTGLDTVSFNAETKVLTVVCDSTVLGEPRELMAGTLVTLINEDVTVGALFEANDSFTPGIMALSETPITFQDGSDGVIIPTGTGYVII